MVSKVTGTLIEYKDFPSRYVTPRNVEIWLPPSYGESGEMRYPVIYMHDGQNLFNPATSTIGIDWGVDEAIIRLIWIEDIPEVIVVGIWCTENRVREYMPQKALETPEGRQANHKFKSEHGGVAISDDYLRFIVKELKLFVDINFRAMPDRESTFIMGSSMGGLVSIYALCEYPEVFAGAGCLSTHWPAGNGIVISYLKDALPEPGLHRIYYDYGTNTLDALYEDYQIQVDQIMRSKGYIEGRNWLTRKFPGAEHSERAWRDRVHIPLTYLLS